MFVKYDSEIDTLREVWKQFRRYRMTPPVDDDFLEVQNDLIKSHEHAEKYINNSAEQETHNVGIDFISLFNHFAHGVNQTAVEKGWWKGDRNEGELIALMHSELSEALEALRHGNLPDDHIPEFSGVEAEFADVIIRIMDLSAAKGYRTAAAILTKIEYNKTRPVMHGGKRF